MCGLRVHALCVGDRCCRKDSMSFPLFSCFVRLSNITGTTSGVAVPFAVSSCTRMWVTATSMPQPPMRRVQLVHDDLLLGDTFTCLDDGRKLYLRGTRSALFNGRGRVEVSVAQKCWWFGRSLSWCLDANAVLRWITRPQNQPGKLAQLMVEGAVEPETPARTTHRLLSPED